MCTVLSINLAKVEVRGVLHISHFDSDAREVLKARGRALLSLSHKVETAATPDTDVSLLSAPLSLLDLSVKRRWLRVVLKVGLSKAFLAELDSEIVSVRHRYVAKESATFVSKG